MDFFYEGGMAPLVSAVEQFENVAGQAGLSSEDLISLLQEHLDLENVMSYVNAVLRNRMN